jgi:hypothetical protein
MKYRDNQQYGTLYYGLSVTVVYFCIHNLYIALEDHALLYHLQS